MTEGLYERYIHSQEWQKRRFAKLEEAEHCCQYCGEPDFLSVHHLNYDHLGYEDSKDLVVLCPSCHWVADELRRNPGSDLRKRLTEKRKKVKQVKPSQPKQPRRKTRKQMTKSERRQHKRIGRKIRKEKQKLAKNKSS